MPRRILVITAVVMLLLAAGCAKRNTAYQEPKILNLLSQIQLVGNPRDISWDADNIYVALDQGGLAVIDRNTNVPRWWPEILPGGENGQLYGARLVSAIASHKLLFIGEYTGSDKIRIVDSSDPDSIRLIDSIYGGTDGLQDMRFIPIPNPQDTNIVQGLFCAGRSVNFLRFNGELYLGVDWSINNLPATASGADMNASHVFVAVQQRGLFIYDRSNQQLVGQLAVPGEAQKVRVLGNYAYIVARQGGFHIVDISNPANPVLKGSYDTDGYATTVDVSGTMAVVSSGGGGVYVFNVANPANPVLMENVTSVGYTNNATFVDDMVVIASRDNGILVYSMDAPNL